MRMMHRGVELDLMIDPTGTGFLVTVTYKWPLEVGMDMQVGEFGPYTTMHQAIDQGERDARQEVDRLIDDGQAR